MPAQDNSPPTTVVSIRGRKRCDVIIDRRTIWGNPFRVGIDGTVEECIAKYRAHILAKPELLDQLHKLKGKQLGCWCKPGPCHGDVLVALIEERCK